MLLVKLEDDDLILNGTDWTRLSDIADAREIFKDATDVLSSQANPTMSLVVPLLHAFKPDQGLESESHDSSQTRF